MTSPCKHLNHLLMIANLPDESITPMSSVCKPGVYFGYAQVYGLSGQEGKVHPMVMSLGWNPFYKNERLTAVCVAFFTQHHYHHSLLVTHKGNPRNARIQV
jgi:FAD synthase